MRNIFLITFLLIAGIAQADSMPGGKPHAGQVAYTNKGNVYTKAQTYATATASTPAVFDGNKNLVSGTAGSGLAISNGTISSNAVYQISFQPGLLTSITSTKAVFGKVSKNSTVDNIEGSSFIFSCISNPTITLYECGTSSTCSSTPVTIGSVTITAAGQVFDGTISSASVTAGDYIAWAITAGTCTSLDIAATSQVHSN